MRGGGSGGGGRGGGGGGRGGGGRGGGRGGHGGGRHHHHGGGFGPGPWWGPGYGSWWDPTWDTDLVVIEPETDEKERIARYLASLPEKDRAAAFAKIYGTQTPAPASVPVPKPTPTPAATGDITIGGVVIPTWALALGGAAAAYFLFVRKKRSR